MVLKITINQADLVKTKQLFTRLPKNVGTALSESTNVISKMIQKGAKLRAPRWTGKLAESIQVRSIKKGYEVIVGQPYGVYQEFGFKPHYVQAFRPTGSGFVVADWAASKGMELTKNSIFVSKHKPFITPAVENTIPKISDLLSKSIAQAIKKS